MNRLDKIDPEILSIVTTESNNDKKYDCIVYTKNCYDFKNSCLRDYDGEIYEYPFIKAFGVRLSKDRIISIANMAVVTYISKQSAVFTQIFVSKRIMEVDNFYKEGFFGGGATVAVIDTGISRHLDFCFPQNKIIKFVDLVNNKEVPYDDNGHGTFVSSIICGSGVVSGFKYSGVAPKTKIISIKALEENGEAGAFKILEAMQWVYDNHEKYNIKVVCMSFGSTPTNKNDPMIMGAEALWNKGVVVVAAAGNSGPEERTIKSPGASGKIITVGGFDDKRIDEEFVEENFEIANFSSRGPAGYFYKPDVVAPAVNIVGADSKGGYVKMSGTSVATPMVAGIACLLFDKFPNLSPNQIKVMLSKTCKKITNNKNNDGFGYINLKGLCF